MALTTDTKNKLVNQLNGTYTDSKVAANVYIGLSTNRTQEEEGSTGFDANTCTGWKEPTATEYKRVTLAEASASTRSLTSASEGETHNDVQIAFPEVTTEAGWGTVYYFGLFTSASASTASVPFLYGKVTLTTSTETPGVEILSGKVPMFRPNALSISIE